jgi:hypothetical protein
MNLFDLKERLDEAGVLITFSGSFTHGIIEELGTAVRKYLESDDVQKSAMMDVFSVYVEAAQNVRNYTAAKLEGGAHRSIARSSIVVIAKQGAHYEVRAGNAVESTDVMEIKTRLDGLTGLDKAALKALYKEQLRKDRPDGGGGAGLGFIDMARRANRPLEYEFTQMDADFSFFSLRVVV